MRGHNGDVLWIDCRREQGKSFVEYVQVFSDKPATMLKNTALVAYIMYLVVMSISLVYQLWLIEKAFTWVGQSPVGRKRYK